MPGEIIRFDARPLLAQGQDPLSAIQAAWQELPPGASLAVCAPFQPRPLAALFSSQGIGVRTQQTDAQTHWLFIGPKPC